MYADLFNKLEFLDYHIQMKSTGSPKDLAKRLGISIRTLHDYLTLLKHLGCPLKFCRTRNTYFYEEKGNLALKFYKRGNFEDNLLQKSVSIP